MQEIWKQVGPQLAELVGALVVLLVVLAKTKLAGYVKAKQSNVALQSALLWLDDTVWSVVAEAAQTITKGLKADLADGKLTREEYLARLAEVKKTVVATVVDRTWGRVQGALGLTDSAQLVPIVASKVEAMVPAAKAALASNPPQG